MSLRQGVLATISAPKCGAIGRRAEPEPEEMSYSSQSATDLSWTILCDSFDLCTLQWHSHLKTPLEEASMVDSNADVSRNDLCLDIGPAAYTWATGRPARRQHGRSGTFAAQRSTKPDDDRQPVPRNKGDRKKCEGRRHVLPLFCYGKVSNPRL